MSEIKKATKQNIYRLLAHFYHHNPQPTQLDLINVATDIFGVPFNPNTLRAYIKNQDSHYGDKAQG